MTVRVFALAVLSAVMSFPPKAPQSPATDVVSVHVAVLDASGRPVRDLTQADFAISDAGRTQVITSFRNGRVPASVVLLVDRSGSMTLMAAQLKDAAEQFVTRVTPDDRVRVGSVASELTLSPSFTNDRDALRSTIRRIGPFGNPSALFDATLSSMDALRAESSRRVVVLLTDGGDTASRTKVKDVMERAQAEGSAIYGVGFWTRILGNRRRPDPRLKELALATGGGYVEVKTDADVNPAIDAVVDEMTSAYLLGSGRRLATANATNYASSCGVPG